MKDEIICGDCQDVLKALPAESVHLTITSPPYNVGLGYDGHSDDMTYQEYLASMMPIWREIKRVLVVGGRFALNVAPTGIKAFGPTHHDMTTQLRELGLRFRTEIL